MKNSSETGHILDLFFSPRRVAIIGLSRNAITSPVSVLTTLKNFGYTGDIFIINPNMETSTENGIYPSLDDLVESIDLAVITVARDHVLDVLRACVRNGIRAAIEVGIDCIEHGSLMSDDTLALAKSRGTFLVATTYLADGMDLTRAAPALQAKAAEVFPRAREMVSKAIQADLLVCCGTDAPAIPHGQNAKELTALVDRGASPLFALRAATTTAARLIDADDRARLAPGLLADIIAVPGNPLTDISVCEDVQFVCKGGEVFKHPASFADNLMTP